MQKKLLCLALTILFSLTTLSVSMAKQKDIEIANEVHLEPAPKEISGRKVAVLFGMSDYPGTTNDLEGPYNDVRAMKNVLEQDDYTVYLYDSLTEAEAKVAISSAFTGSAADNTLLFYYSGHGSTYNGQSTLCFSDSDMTVDELTNELNPYAGTKVVLIDCCHSGGFINRGNNKSVATINSEDYLKNLIQGFEQADYAAKSSKYLNSPTYKVLAACAGNEYSWEGTINGVTYGIFTYFYAKGCGYFDNYTSFPADSNNNNAITQREMYNYINSNDDPWSYFDIYQTLKAYPYENGDANFILFGGAAPYYWVIEATAPNGTVTRRSRYTAAGILEITEYYTDAGILTQKIHFRPDGTKRAIQEYHGSGGLKSNITYDDSGEVVTNSENYDESGTLLTRVYYYPGLIPYLTNHYRADGTRSAMQEFYGSGNLKTNIFYDATGDVVTNTENYDDASGRLLTRVYYHSELNPYLTNHYREDGTRSAMQEFYASGNLKTNIFYDATGDVVTNTENYDETSGRLLTRVYYYPGLIPYLTNHYQEDGTRNAMQEFYASGNLKTNIYYDASGDIITHTENYDSTGTVLETRVEYDAEFHPTTTTYYRADGTKYKEYEYYPSGATKTEINYDETETETSRINYDENGNLI